MLIILSPSKTIKATTHTCVDTFTTSKFISESEKIVSEIKKLNTSQLSNLMNISPQLSQLNFERYQYWNNSHNLINSKQALLSFKGEVFTGIDVKSFSNHDFLYAQNHLVILSGLYGILQPLDLIQPYRLEISTKIKISNTKNLYAFWKDKITEHVNYIVKKNNTSTIINLASNEYFKVVNTKKLNANIITPVFKEYKNGNYKVVTIYAKKARGLMTNYIIKNQINKPNDIKFFDKDGYYYNELLSNDNQLVFTRG